MRPRYLIILCALTGVILAGCAFYSDSDSGLEKKPMREPAPVPNGMIEASMVEFHGEEHGATGGAEAIVGDIDGDGLDDIVIVGRSGSEAAEEIGGIRGGAYVFYGRTAYQKEYSVLEADAVLRGASNFVSGVGDLDGDGLDDFAFIGEFDMTNPGDYLVASGVHLLYGSPERLSGQQMASSVGVYITPPFPDSVYPDLFCVRGAGDVNGDGLDDMLIEMRIEGYEPTPKVVYSYLILGSRDRLPASYSLSGAQAVFEGTDGEYFMEHGTASAGDVNGDGYSDILITTRDAEWKWRVGLYYGGEDAFSGSISPADADAFFPMESLWATVGGLGDLDGDGLDDFTVSSHWAIPVVYGRAEKLSGVQTEEIAEFTIKPEGAPSYLAGLGMGDVDADGNLDIIVGDPHQNRNGMQTGALYLMLGADCRFLDQHNLGESYALMYGKNTHEIDGGLGEDLGYGVSSGGDVNGDGYHDILAGAPGDVFGDEFGGTVYLIFGGPRKE